MQCSRCNAELPDDANFCHKCGMPVTAAPEAAVTQQVDKVETDGAVAGMVHGDHAQLGGQRQYISVDPTKPDRQAVLDNYLRDLRQHCNALPLAALSEEEGPHQKARITLNSAYIDLDTTTQVPLHKG